MYQFATEIPPIDDNLLDFKFPEVITSKIENGLTLLFIEQPGLSKAYFRLGIDFGDKQEPSGREGAVKLLSRVMKKGTQSRTAEEIADAIEFLGGSLDVSSSPDFFFVSGEFLKEYSDNALEIMSDIIRHPAFNTEEIEKERRRMIANIENEKSSPSFLANRRLGKAVFYPHPYSRYKSVTSLSAIAKTDLTGMYKRYVKPAHSVLAVAGDFSLPEIRSMVQKHLGEWNGKEMPEQEIYQPLPKKERQIHLVNREGSEQSFILMGNLLFDRRHPEYEKVLVMNKILGGGASSRLFMNLREEKGYTYGAYSSLRNYKETGVWVAQAEVGTGVTGLSLEAFFEEFEKIKKEPASEEDIKNAKRYLIGSFPLQNESPASLAHLALSQKLHQLPENYWDNYLRKIDEVTEDDIQAMARKYIIEHAMSVIIVGDVTAIEKQVQLFGKTEVFDLEDIRIR